MPVVISEFEMNAPPPPPANPAANVRGVSAEPPPALTLPAQAQRIEIERRERALRLFAH
jgi:hypothetical protein